LHVTYDTSETSETNETSETSETSETKSKYRLFQKPLPVKEGTLQLAQYKGFLPSLKNTSQPGSGDEAGTHANRVGGRMT